MALGSIGWLGVDGGLGVTRIRLALDVLLTDWHAVRVVLRIEVEEGLVGVRLCCLPCDWLLLELAGLSVLLEGSALLLDGSVVLPLEPVHRLPRLTHPQADGHHQCRHPKAQHQRNTRCFIRLLHQPFHLLHVPPRVSLHALILYKAPQLFHLFHVHRHLHEQ